MPKLTILFLVFSLFLFNSKAEVQQNYLEKKKNQLSQMKPEYLA